MSDVSTCATPLLRSRPLICIQGLGLVGAAMAVAVALARDADGYCFQVVGLDLPTRSGEERVAAINAGRFPFANRDLRLTESLRQAVAEGRLRAVTDPSVLAEAAVVVVDVGLDLDGLTGEDVGITLAGFEAAIGAIAARLTPGALVVIETTVPPGTCERVVAPLLAAGLEARGHPREDFLLAHAYERVMPGADYLDSLTRYWRVYAGHTPAAAQACEAFLARVVDVRAFPLTRLPNTRSSEVAKLLENSYRAVTIALMEEWGRLAERLGIDLFQVVAAIRQRPTHSNMRQPGFGVGGYCLTKDPLFAWVAARDWFGWPELDFPLCRTAVACNQQAPLATLAMVRQGLSGSLQRRRLLLLGVSYRPMVADTRHSPSYTFWQAAREEGALVHCQDPLVGYWEEADLIVDTQWPSPEGWDAVIFAVAHPEYRQIDPASWLGDHRPLVVDANDCLTSLQRQRFLELGCPVWGIGRGRME